MRYTIFDIETDGLYNTVSKIHCLSYQVLEDNQIVEKGTLVFYKEMVDFLKNQECLVGHNIIKYDIPVIEKILGHKIKCEVVDTLAISWYLYPYRAKHGLEVWGDELGIAKPKIDDWDNLGIDDYMNRCEVDVEINMKLFIQQFGYLVFLYQDVFQVANLFRYLGFKMQCLLEQELEGIELDEYLCEQTKLDLEFVIEEKTRELTKNMPKQVEKTAPKKMYKIDGSLSSLGQKWVDLLKSRGLPLETTEIYRDGNPGSHTQLKAWLDSQGWQPKTFSISKSTGEKIAQVSLPFGGGICDSVKDLYEKEPSLKHLEGLYVARHRLGLIKSFLASKDENGKVYSTAHGFTNTMRLQHGKPVVNLPSKHKPYGAEIRGCLKAPKGKIMCGSDVSGLEDNTKQHYIYFFDPQYVEEMRVEGFDPHLDIGMLAGLVTEDESEFYKWYEETYK